MRKTAITIEVDAETAQAFSQASAADRRKLELLLNLHLRELTTRETRSLTGVLDDIGTQAEARGLTPAILESLLQDQ
jgi:hypothetical protein